MISFYFVNLDNICISSAHDSRNTNQKTRSIFNCLEIFSKVFGRRGGPPGSPALGPPASRRIGDTIAERLSDPGFRSPGPRRAPGFRSLGPPGSPARAFGPPAYAARAPGPSGPPGSADFRSSVKQRKAKQSTAKSNRRNMCQLLVPPGFAGFRSSEK